MEDCEIGMFDLLLFVFCEILEKVLVFGLLVEGELYIGFGDVFLESENGSLGLIGRYLD